MVLSKSCVYGIRAVLYIATRDQQGFVPIRGIARDLDISFHFLTKILQTLTHKNILTSQKGASGGISLARPAAEITLGELVESLDGPELFSECILGIPECGRAKPCPLHEQWNSLRTGMENMFNHTSLAEIALKITQQGLRLSDESVKKLLK